MLTGDIGIMLQAVDVTGNGPGHGSFRVGDAVAHGIAGPDLYGDPGFLAQILQLIDKGNHEAVKICPGDILQMTTGDHSGVEGILDGTEIVIQTLTSGHLHFLENMIV